MDSYKISLESFRSFRGPLFRIPGTGKELFLPFLRQISSSLPLCECNVIIFCSCLSGFHCCGLPLFDTAFFTGFKPVLSCRICGGRKDSLHAKVKPDSFKVIGNRGVMSSCQMWLDLLVRSVRWT